MTAGMAVVRASCATLLLCTLASLEVRVSAGASASTSATAQNLQKTTNNKAGTHHVVSKRESASVPNGDDPYGDSTYFDLEINQAFPGMLKAAQRTTGVQEDPYRDSAYLDRAINRAFPVARSTSERHPVHVKAAKNSNTASRRHGHQSVDVAVAADHGPNHEQHQGSYMETAVTLGDLTARKDGKKTSVRRHHNEKASARPAHLRPTQHAREPNQARKTLAGHALTQDSHLKAGHRSRTSSNTIKKQQRKSAALRLNANHKRGKPASKKKVEKSESYSRVGGKQEHIGSVDVMDTISSAFNLYGSGGSGFSPGDATERHADKSVTKAVGDNGEHSPGHKVSKSATELPTYSSRHGDDDPETVEAGEGASGSGDGSSSGDSYSASESATVDFQMGSGSGGFGLPPLGGSGEGSGLQPEESGSGHQHSGDGSSSGDGHSGGGEDKQPDQGGSGEHHEGGGSQPEEGGHGRDEQPAADGLSEEETKVLLESHNRVRANVSPAPCDPLPELHYDSDRLGKMAQSYAEQCQFHHNPELKLYNNPELKSYNDPTSSPGSTSHTVGENMYMTTLIGDHPDEAVVSWADEAAFYDASTGACIAELQCRHYTQIVWSATRFVGCGTAVCAASTTEDYPFDADRFPEARLVVCNYSPSGNVRGKIPYEVCDEQNSTDYDAQPAHKPAPNAAVALVANEDDVAHQPSNVEAAVEHRSNNDVISHLEQELFDIEHSLEKLLTTDRSRSDIPASHAGRHPSKHHADHHQQQHRAGPHPAPRQAGQHTPQHRAGHHPSQHLAGHHAPQHRAAHHAQPQHAAKTQARSADTSTGHHKKPSSPHDGQQMIMRKRRALLRKKPAQ
ncbi:uncharacterized protein LOC135819267 [Sycon ciliatum]|uniref:uncharacterized protein LOC135819267 n=1 Tax=Sycon ciliatum TaxID=27933 RepID=UPI0031F64159